MNITSKIKKKWNYCLCFLEFLFASQRSKDQTLNIILDLEEAWWSRRSRRSRRNIKLLGFICYQATPIFEPASGRHFNFKILRLKAFLEWFADIAWDHQAMQTSDVEPRCFWMVRTFISMFMTLIQNKLCI